MILLEKVGSQKPWCLVEVVTGYGEFVLGFGLLNYIIKTIFGYGVITNQKTAFVVYNCNYIKNRFRV